MNHVPSTLDLQAMVRELRTQIGVAATRGAHVAERTLVGSPTPLPPPLLELQMMACWAAAHGYQLAAVLQEVAKHDCDHANELLEHLIGVVQAVAGDGDDGRLADVWPAIERSLTRGVGTQQWDAEHMTPPASAGAALRLALGEQDARPGPDVVWRALAGHGYTIVPVGMVDVLRGIHATAEAYGAASHAADVLAPAPENRDDATDQVWLRHYAAEGLAAVVGYRKALKTIVRKSPRGSRPDFGYLVHHAVACTMAAVQLAYPADGPVPHARRMWDLTPELGALDGEWEEWLTAVLDMHGVNPADIDPDLTAAGFKSPSRAAEIEPYKASPAPIDLPPPPPSAPLRTLVEVHQLASRAKTMRAGSGEPLNGEWLLAELERILNAGGGQ